MNRHTFSISGSSIDPKIELDGTNIASALQGLKLSMAAGELATVELNAVAFVASAELGDAIVHLPAETHELLLKLGWTPPPEDT